LRRLRRDSTKRTQRRRDHSEISLTRKTRCFRVFIAHANCGLRWNVVQPLLRDPQTFQAEVVAALMSRIRTLFMDLSPMEEPRRSSNSQTDTPLGREVWTRADLPGAEPSGAGAPRRPYGSKTGPTVDVGRSRPHKCLVAESFARRRGPVDCGVPLDGRPAPRSPRNITELGVSPILGRATFKLPEALR
jgi:hypothetical protein